MTAASKRRLTRVAALGCVVCRRPAEIHHVRSNGSRRDDAAVIGLCPDHHRNGGHGEALHAGVQTWEARHGTQASWLDWVAQQLGEVVDDR